MATKALFMETTLVSSIKSAGEISTLLVASGARQISTEYDNSMRISGLRFTLMLQNVPLIFALPVRTDPIYKILLKRRKGILSEHEEAKIRDQAERVAWRQILRWIQAQLAMIDVGMVQAPEVFLPYMLQAGTSQTLFDNFQTTGLKQLAAAK